METFYLVDQKIHGKYLRTVTKSIQLIKKAKKHFNLPLKRVYFFDYNKTLHGFCKGYSIHIFLRPKYSRKLILDTVAHELAHLRYKHHKDEFWAFYTRIKAYIYR